VVEYLPSKLEALNSHCSTTKKERKERRKKERKRKEVIRRWIGS
jgi:hypothetical protein